ncbi:MAG TPA: DUF488 domain-containing protein [Gammaproteobacteria bacterium]|nr:DUF488 domain-containing protein [Gammaproteobacteria bacterium]
MLILTVGHSTRPFDELLGLLQEHRVMLLADVRTVPRSRHNPQYNSDVLARALAAVGLAYRHMPELGGLRKPRKDSINTGWRNAGFRGFADYMQTPEFEAALGGLIGLAEKGCVCIMCAEAVPWRCHRSLIGDALTVRGVEVRDIMGPDKTPLHELTPFAEVHGSEITYPFTLEG